MTGGAGDQLMTIATNPVAGARCYKSCWFDSSWRLSLTGGYASWEIQNERRTTHSNAHQWPRQGALTLLNPTQPCLSPRSRNTLEVLPSAVELNKLCLSLTLGTLLGQSEVNPKMNLQTIMPTLFGSKQWVECEGMDLLDFCCFCISWKGLSRIGSILEILWENNT